MARRMDVCYSTLQGTWRDHGTMTALLWRVTGTMDASGSARHLFRSVNGLCCNHHAILCLGEYTLIWGMLGILPYHSNVGVFLYTGKLHQADSLAESVSTPQLHAASHAFILYVMGCLLLLCSPHARLRVLTV